MKEVVDVVATCKAGVGFHPQHSGSNESKRNRRNMRIEEIRYFKYSSQTIGTGCIDLVGKYQRKIY